MPHGFSDKIPRVQCMMHVLELYMEVPVHPLLCQFLKQKGQISNLGAPPCQGNPDCNRDQILPAEPETIRVNEIHFFLSGGVRATDPSAPAVLPPAGHRT